jgi:hypothetical protein
LIFSFIQKASLGYSPILSESLVNSNTNIS